MSRLTDLASSSRGKWAVLVAWLVVASVLILATPSLDEVRENDDAQFLPTDAEATRANALAEERFPDDGVPAITVFQRDGGLTPDDEAAAEEFAAWAQSDDAPDLVRGVVASSTVPQQAEELASPDGSTLLVILNLVGDPAEPEFTTAIEAIRDRASEAAGGGLTVLVAGPAGLIVDLVSVFSDIDGLLLLVTVSLVLVLLILIYRSPVMALVPLTAVGLVFQMSNGAAAWIADLTGLAVSGQATGIMTVVLFGAGTDYTLFVSARYREELGYVEDRHEAMRRSMRGVGGAVASAGGTILLAAAVLLLADYRSYQSLGPVIAIAVALMMLAALTLVPAILAVLGRWSFWPFRPRHEPETAGGPAGGIYGRVAHFVLDRPGTVLAVTTVALVAMIGGLGLFRAEYDSLERLPSDTESVRGFALIREGFPAGEVSPVEVFVELPDSEVLSQQGLDSVDAISTALGDHPAVAGVQGPSRPLGLDAPVGPDEVLGGGGGGPPAGEAAARFVSADGRVARVEVVLSENPYASEALDLIPELRTVASDAAAAAGLAREDVLIGGETAEAYDTRVANTRDTLVILPLVLLAIAMVLGLLLRSIVAPLYLSATIVLTYFSTLGLAVAFFRLVLGHEGISPSVPFYLFVFLNALGVDYNIYLMSRIREESRRLGLREATESALAQTGGVITSAGLILAGTFSALMTLPLQDLFQLGFAVAIGVLMDTFITRTLVVPCIVALLGRWNWWPGTTQAAEATGSAPMAGSETSD